MAEQIQDITQYDGATSHEGVRFTQAVARPWLEGFPECAALGQSRIEHVGIARVNPPYRVARSHSDYTYFLTSLKGQGRILIDGRWKLCRPGNACLIPPHFPYSLEGDDSGRWEFCWVCYHHGGRQSPLVHHGSPVLAPFQAQPLFAAITGFRHECESSADEHLVRQWIDLIHGYVVRFARPWAKDDRIMELWGRVAADLKSDWTLERLARQVGYSHEHLRRLCHRQLGRSPMHQVIYLRMKRAAELLISTRDKIETIALEVGYQNPFVFSNTFTKWIGCRPSDYRTRGSSPDR